MMTGYVITPNPQASAAVAGTDERFPVRRIFCVGRNYAAHAREMGFSDKEPPFFFTKPADALVETGSTIPYPPITENLHYEIELVLAIGTGGANITPEDAISHIWGAGVGIDFTRRDQQIAHREKGRPWDWGKAFDLSAPTGPICRRDDATDLDLKKSVIRLFLDDQIKQDATLGELIWSVPEIISTISDSIELKPGDLIMTGTPAGVGPIMPGQDLKVQITGLPDTILHIDERLNSLNA